MEDFGLKRKLIAQVIDVQFASVPGLLEEFLRDSTSDEFISGDNYDPLSVSNHISHIQDACMLICRIRGTLHQNRLQLNSSWLPSRSKSGITRISIDSLLKSAGQMSEFPISIGETKDGSELSITAHDLDGRLNIITGKKGTGKSYLSKLLVLGLVNYNATVVVFDLNGEYSGLGHSVDGEKNEYSERIHGS